MTTSDHYNSKLQLNPTTSLVTKHLFFHSVYNKETH